MVDVLAGALIYGGFEEGLPVDGFEFVADTCRLDDLIFVFVAVVEPEYAGVPIEGAVAVVAEYSVAYLGVDDGWVGV